MGLFDFVQLLYEQEAVRFFFIDEVHKYPGWVQEIKNIHDSFPTIHIMFSGSSSINLSRGAYDLSRRAIIKHLPGLSFREYLSVTMDQICPVLPLDDLLHNSPEIILPYSDIPGLKGKFKKYISSAYYPFFLEGDNSYHEKLGSIINKTIFGDIASFYKLKTENLHIFKKILFFLSTIPPGKINTNNLSRNLGIDNKTVAHYLNILAETGLTRMLFSDTGGQNLIRKPQKVYLENTTLYHTLCRELDLTTDSGSIRELFFLSMLSNTGKTVVYDRSNADFCVDRNIFEIGGSSKKRKQISGRKNVYLVKDDILVGSKHTIPLYAFGLIY
jgi:predicted AAA+ superfamily ATPase